MEGMPLKVFCRIINLCKINQTGYVKSLFIFPFNSIIYVKNPSKIYKDLDAFI